MDIMCIHSFPTCRCCIAFTVPGIVEESARNWIPSFSASRSKNPTCPFRILVAASCSVNQPALSTSGNSRIRPDFGGHSILNKLLSIIAGSRSLSIAQTLMIFPLGCLISPREIKSPSTLRLVSSSNSRFAAVSGFSPSEYSPFGNDQAPKSFLSQKRPAWMHEKYFHTRTGSPEYQ